MSRYTLTYWSQMKILDKDDFIARKKHDALAVMGSGFSINTISDFLWERIKNDFDSIGFNWFCNALRYTTFYLIREQCVTPLKIEAGNELNDLIAKINTIVPTLIVKRKTRAVKNNPDAYSHVANLHVFETDGVVVDDISVKTGAEGFKADIFKDGMHHGKATIYDILHFAVFMGYQEIVFFGVDLCDSRYFWLKYDETRELLIRRGRQINDIHNTAANTMKIIQDFKNTFPDIALWVHNPNSLLTKIIPVWR